ncbi:MAG TPA: ice-binding family protein [Thermoanaerobaculia bacterium]|nr:ice-binding family protein [Thermoanaerobaculia bacterium]
MSHAAAANAPSLGSAASFAVLGGSAVANSGGTRISGNVGVTPGNTVQGLPPSALIVGDIFVNDATARQAHADSAAAYAQLAALTTCTQLDGIVAPPPGIYCVTSLPPTLTLTGNASDVWIFLVKGSLTTPDDSSVLLRGGATYNNVFWQVDGSMTLGARSAFVGTILAHDDITLKRDVSMSGRAQSQTGVVRLDTDDVSCCDPIEFTPPSLPAAKVGVAYNQSIVTSGGMAPYQVSLFDGALPPGLTPSPVSGTPTTEGTYTFTLIAVDARGCSSIHTYTIAVCGTIVVTFDAKPDAKACQLFTRQIVVTGCSPPYKIAVTGLPDGLTNSGDTISGIPTTPGCSPITIAVTDANGFTVSLTVTLCVDCGLTLPDLNPPAATACLPYSADVTPSCGKPPYVYTAIDFPPWLFGPMPSVISPAPGNVVYGTPPVPGPVMFTVKVTDANGCTDTRTYTLNVAPGPPPAALPKITLPNGVVCTPYNPTPLPGVLVDPAALPPGLTFVNSTLQGVPTQCGTFCFKMKIANPPACTSDTQEYCITVELPPLTLQPLAPLQAGVPTNQTLTPPFCIPFTCSVSGTPPPGISGGCVLQGTPQCGDYDFCVTAVADACPVITRCYKGSVSPCCGSLTLSPSSRFLPIATVGAGYAQMFTASGGTPPYKYIVAAPSSLPPEFSLGQTSGILSASPAMTPGRFNFAVIATDAAGCSVSVVYTIDVTPFPPPVPLIPIPALSPWAMLLLAMGLGAAGMIRRWS